MGVLITCLVVGCTSAGTGVSSSVATTLQTSTTLGGTTLPPVVECPGPGDFAEGSGIADLDATGTDGTTLGRITWGQSDQCETFRFEFESAEGAPATSIPTVRVGHVETFQVLRVEMDITDTVVTDQLVESGFVSRMFVVRALDGGMFVDLHLTRPAATRVRVQSSPAALVVDLRPGLVDFTGVASIGERTVLVAPTDGATTTQITDLAGYARTFEANVIAQVRRDGAVILETNTTAADYSETWGEFRMPVTLPTGEVQLFVGEASPEDGDLEGVTIDLEVN